MEDNGRRYRIEIALNISSQEHQKNVVRRYEKLEKIVNEGLRLALGTCLLYTSTLIGRPKLDDVDYSEKLTEIIRNNDIKSVTVVRMEVPCCGGLEHAAVTALKNSGKFIPWNVVTISIDGKILD